MKESFRQYIEQFGSLLNELGRNGSEKVYAHLLKGESLSASLFAELLHVNMEEAEKIIASYAEVIDEGRIAGFLGLSLVPTPHKLMVKGKALYTWCAMDAIILPQLLLLEALIESVDPLNGQRIQLSVNEDFLDWTDPVPVFISWTEKNASSDIR
jgi:alkylmercury lyase